MDPLLTTLVREEKGSGKSLCSVSCRFPIIFEETLSSIAY